MIPAHCPLPIIDGTPTQGEATQALVVILNNHCWCCCYGDYYCSSPYYCCCYYCNVLLQPARPPPRAPQQAVQLRSSKEIVATFGWLEDLPMLVNQLQFFSFFYIFFLFFISTSLIFVGAACQCLSMLGTIVFMN